jgi:PKD repeat protein
METNVSRSHMNLRLLTTAIALVALSGCNLTKQSAPDLTGPSTLGRSVVLIASPDRILYDGTSVATITATVRNAAGNPEPNVALQWEAWVVTISGGVRTTTSVPVEPPPQYSTTGSNGTATTVVRAPLAPDVMPSGMTMLQVLATPVGDDASQLAPGLDAKWRFIDIELLPQSGNNAPDRLPVVDFTISPPVATINQTITFDASLTRDEGVICGDRCTYTWEFGSDAANKTGRVVTQSFPSAGTRTIRLHVTDEKGFTATKSTTLVINAPAAPTASFFVIPVQPKIGSAATFDASASTVGIGAQIVSYVWDFGENGATGTGKVTTYAYQNAVTLTKSVTLTVTDDLGRTAQRTLTLTAIP